MTLDSHDVAAIDRLREALKTRSVQELLVACRAGDEETLNLVCHALPAIRCSLGFTAEEFTGLDLAVELGMARPVEH